MTEALLLDAVKAGSPWGALAIAVWKLSPFLQQAVELYAKNTLANEKQAEAIKALAEGVAKASKGIDGLLEGKGCRAVEQWNGSERRTAGRG